MNPSIPPSLELSDETLCCQAAQGDREAEELLVTRYNRLVRICARPYFLAGGDSEDLIQEGMVGLLSAIREYRREERVSFRTFAETCVRNRLFSAIKAATRDKHTPLNNYISFETPFFDGNAGYSAFPPQSEQSDPETLYIRQESHRERAEDLKDRLSSFEAEILRLYLTGLSYLEIAAAVHRPQKSVDNAVQRIRRKVAQQISSGDLSRR